MLSTADGWGKYMLNCDFIKVYLSIHFLIWRFLLMSRDIIYKLFSYDIWLNIYVVYKEGQQQRWCTKI